MSRGRGAKEQRQTRVRDESIIRHAVHLGASSNSSSSFLSTSLKVSASRNNTNKTVDVALWGREDCLAIATKTFCHFTCVVQGMWMVRPRKLLSRTFDDHLRNAHSHKEYNTIQTRMKEKTHPSTNLPSTLVENSKFKSYRRDIAAGGSQNDRKKMRSVAEATKASSFSDDGDG